MLPFRAPQIQYRIVRIAKARSLSREPLEVAAKETVSADNVVLHDVSLLQRLVHVHRTFVIFFLFVVVVRMSDLLLLVRALVLGLSSEKELVDRETLQGQRLDANHRSASVGGIWNH